MPRTTRNGQTRRLLRWCFGSIVALLMLAQAIGYFQWHEVRPNVDLIGRNALESVALINRMGMDIQRQRILIARHIFEHEQSQMKVVEAQIDAVRSDYAVAARAYAPLATFPGEGLAWAQLIQDVAVAEQRSFVAIQLSRADRDAEATQKMVDAEPAFDAIDRDLAVIIAINRAAANHANDKIDGLLRDVLGLRLFLTVGIIVLTVVIGIWGSRMISRTEQRLILQAAALENRNRELDAFAGRVSHDLRGPLNTISLAASMLSERAPPGDSTPGILRRGVNQMASLVEDLLALSRLGAPMVGVSTLTAPVAASIKDDLGPIVKEVGGSLFVDVEPATVRCSEGLLRQVLWNLGENAVKYRRPNVAPHVELLGRVTQRGYQFQVSDNGAGMSADDARHAFEPFFRGQHDRAIPGTGLGLAIVRRIVEASGGTVSLDSRLGQGTTFVIELPLARSSEARIARSQ